MARADTRDTRDTRDGIVIIIERNNGGDCEAIEIEFFFAKE